MIKITYIIEKTGPTDVVDPDIHRTITQFGQDLTSVIRSTAAKERRASDVEIGTEIQPQKVDVTVHGDPSPNMLEVLKGVPTKQFPPISDQCGAGLHQQCQTTAGCGCPCHRILGSV
jgi:hypothetical protein